MSIQPRSSVFLETADFIGAKLSRDAIWSGQRCTWYGVSVPQMQRTAEREAQSVCGSDFFSGTSGIGLFLARLFAITGERVFRITAEGAIRQALSKLDDFPSDSRTSFHIGLTGVAYSLLEIAECCGIDKFNDMGLLVMEETARDDSPTCDAATIIALLRMHQRHQQDFLLGLAIRCGDALMTQLSNHPGSLSEKDTFGASSAMVELFKATGEEKYRNSTEQVLLNGAGHHETSVGDEITLARALLRASAILGRNTYSQQAREIIQAIQLTTNALLDGDPDFTLARGLAGKADTVLEAARILDEDQLRRTAERVGNWGIEQYKEPDLPWPCGSTTQMDSPSFMVGVAGIGYFYLRLHESSRVPSLLFA